MIKWLKIKIMDMRRTIGCIYYKIHKKRGKYLCFGTMKHKQNRGWGEPIDICKDCPFLIKDELKREGV